MEGLAGVSAIWLRARAQLRGRARATVLLAVLVGLAGGVVLAAVAGARRTDAALPRFLARDPFQVDAVVFAPGGGQQQREARTLAGLPVVAQAIRITDVVVSSVDPASPTGRRRDSGFLPMDPSGGQIYGHPIMIAGRLPDERRPDEAVIDEELAARRRLGVGSSWRVGAYTTAQLDQAGGESSTPPAGPAVDLRIVGIVRHPADLLPTVTDEDSLLLNHGELYLTPAFWRHHGPDLAGHGVITGVVLRRGATDLPRLAADVRRVLGPQVWVGPIGPEFGASASTPGGTMGGLDRAIQLEAGALLAFAALAAMAAVLLVGQTLGRQLALESIEYPTLRAVGMTRGQLVGVALVRATVIGVSGAAIAVAVAIALSPLTPIGLARGAELHPGVVVDRAVLWPGALAVAGLVAASAAVAAWRASRPAATPLGVVEPGGGGRPSRLAGVLAGAGLPPTAVTGVRLAMEPGRGRTAVPVRAAILGAAAAVCAVTAAAVFTASLGRLVATPAAYGWTWDVSVGNFTTSPEVRRAAEVLDATPGVDAYTGVYISTLLVDGTTVDAMALESGKDTVPLQMLDGHEPARPGEIALGTATLRRLGKHLGDRVTVALAPGQPTQRLRVVGRLVLGAGPLDPEIAPAKGAVVDLAVLRRLGSGFFPQSFLVRLDPTADRGRVVGTLQRAFPGTIVRPRPHPDIANVQRVVYLPGLLAAMVALLALGTVTHALVSSVRRRRRDLAVLKTLGFLPRQVSVTVAWQATAFAVAATLAGLPLGVAVGRWAWRLVAVQLGVAPAPAVLPVQLLVIAGAAVLAANLIGVGPGWVAGRLRPAVVLRSE
jgi:ABC-type lipoprotein release transport system permease subunit